MRRFPALIVILLPVAAGALGYALESATDASLVLEGPSGILVMGVPSEEIDCEFQIRNGVNRAITPRVIATNCGCNRWEFSPSVVGPGESFLFRVKVVPPTSSPSQLQTFVIGIQEEGRADGLEVQVLVRRRLGKGLLLNPKSVLLGSRVVGQHVRQVRFSVVYHDPDTTGDPVVDLRATVEGAQVLGMSVVDAGFHATPGRFSGEIEISIQVDPGTRVLHGVLRCGSSPCEEFTLTFN